MKKESDEPIRVMIIDDHRLFNDGLNAMLEEESSIQVLKRVYDSREAQEHVKKFKPDVVLMDFNMPHLNGIELTRILLKDNAELKILILSMYDEERHIESFKSIGTRGYLFKTASAEEVAEAIHKVYAGDFYFPEPKAGSNHADDKFLQKLRLSKRELEVIQLIKQGLKTKEIAEKLNISFYTAETHRKNIKLKAGIKGEADFIKFIYEL
jgi:two-component system nitrate/nitrite response regulator NarL